MAASRGGCELSRSGATGTRWSAVNLDSWLLLGLIIPLIGYNAALLHYSVM